MGKLTDWMKANSKEGANLAEFEELLKTETVSGITTKEQAIDWMVKNPNTAFKSALDYREQQASEARERNFKEKNLPELIKTEREKFQCHRIRGMGNGRLTAKIGHARHYRDQSDERRPLCP